MGTVDKGVKKEEKKHALLPSGKAAFPTLGTLARKTPIKVRRLQTPPPYLGQVRENVHYVGRYECSAVTLPYLRRWKFV